MFSIHRHQKTVLWILATGALLCCVSGCTITVHASVKDENGHPVQDAVVFVKEVQGGAPAAAPAARGIAAARLESIELNSQKIVPHVMPIQIGTTVSFCNRDAILHHIYSISPSRPFAVTINRGAISPGLVFDKPGVVVLGSALNDRMIGYIYVLNTPWFAKTGADGKADLRNLPKGTYDVCVWHPGMKRSPEATVKRVAADSRGEASAKFSLSLPSALNPGSAPTPTVLPAAGGK